ncbi:MAG: hypothetical protein FWC61_03390 [Proteobacteria bacterium]|nr:hypothetical protein [Pseudomonadota bacterium]
MKTVPVTPKEFDKICGEGFSKKSSLIPADDEYYVEELTVKGKKKLAWKFNNIEIVDGEEIEVIAGGRKTYAVVMRGMVGNWLIRSSREWFAKKK